MTEQEFNSQVWRRFDVVTTDTGIETTVMNVCFATRSVRIFVKNAPPEWMPCKRIEKHTTHKGDTADEGTIIEELHNKCIRQQDDIERLREEKKALQEKISRNYLGDILRAVNLMQQGLTERKRKMEQVERGLNQIQAALIKMEEQE